MDERSMAMKQIPLAIRHQAAPSFDNFIVGGNALTLAQLKALRPREGAAPQSLYLWGPSGVGKTHLLRALAADWQAEGGAAVVHGVAPDTLDPDTLRDAMLNPQWRLLVLDACDGFDADQQQAAFALFVEASTRGAAIASAGGLPPIDLALRDDLRTRLGWGLVLPVQPLSEAQSRSALRSEADRRGLVLSEDVMTYLLTRFPRDLKHLMHLFDRLDDFALSRKRALTVPLLKQMLAESSPETP
jgi:DnaA family protein